LLAPPNPQFNQPGDFDIETWNYRTPAIPSGLTVPFKVNAFVYFDYSTTGSVAWTLVDKEFYRVNYARTQKKPAGPVVSNTNAPVKILVPASQSDYFILFDPSNPTNTKPVQIELVNVGSGFPVSETLPGRLDGNITIQGPGNARFSECLGKTNTKTVNIDNTNVDYIRLSVAGGRSTISCSITFDAGTSLVGEDIVRLNFDLRYLYYLQAPVTLTVSSIGK